MHDVSTQETENQAMKGLETRRSGSRVPDCHKLWHCHRKAVLYVSRKLYYVFQNHDCC